MVERESLIISLIAAAVILPALVFLCGLRSKVKREAPVGPSMANRLGSGIAKADIDPILQPNWVTRNALRESKQQYNLAVVVPGKQNRLTRGSVGGDEQIHIVLRQPSTMADRYALPTHLSKQLGKSGRCNPGTNGSILPASTRQPQDGSTSGTMSPMLFERAAQSPPSLQRPDAALTAPCVRGLTRGAAVHNSCIHVRTPRCGGPSDPSQITRGNTPGSEAVSRRSVRSHLHTALDGTTDATANTSMYVTEIQPADDVIEPPSASSPRSPQVMSVVQRYSSPGGAAGQQPMMAGDWGPAVRGGGFNGNNHFGARGSSDGEIHFSTESLSPIGDRPPRGPSPLTVHTMPSTLPPSTRVHAGTSLTAPRSPKAAAAAGTITPAAVVAARAPGVDGSGIAHLREGQHRVQQQHHQPQQQQKQFFQQPQFQQAQQQLGNARSTSHDAVEKLVPGVDWSEAPDGIMQRQAGTRGTSSLNLTSTGPTTTATLIGRRATGGWGGGGLQREGDSLLTATNDVRVRTTMPRQSVMQCSTGSLAMSDVRVSPAVSNRDTASDVGRLSSCVGDGDSYQPGMLRVELPSFIEPSFTERRGDNTSNLLAAADSKRRGTSGGLSRMSMMHTTRPGGEVAAGASRTGNVLVNALSSEASLPGSTEVLDFPPLRSGTRGSFSHRENDAPATSQPPQQSAPAAPPLGLRDRGVSFAFRRDEAPGGSGRGGGGGAGRVGWNGMLAGSIMDATASLALVTAPQFNTWGGEGGSYAAVGSSLGPGSASLNSRAARVQALLARNRSNLSRLATTVTGVIEPVQVL